MKRFLKSEFEIDFQVRPLAMSLTGKVIYRHHSD